jgi:hypothetical protein
VPTIVPDERSSRMSLLLRSDPERTLWWASPVECQSALARHHREGRLSAMLVEQGLHRLTELIQAVDIIAPNLRLRDRAGRLVAAHPLRAGDALQLAAALMWCDDEPGATTSFVCLDTRLRDAARREGFAILPA